MNMNNVYIKGLSKSFGKNRILDNIEFEIPGGKITGIIGNNGVGKTTLIKCLTSFYTDFKGEIQVDNNKKLANSDLSYIPDSPVFYEELTFGEHMEFISAINSSEESIDYYVRQFDMKKYMNKFPKELSKGTLQRMMIILALLRRRKILIADEPFDGLDPGQINILKEEFRRVKNEGVAVLLSSHQLSLVEEICDNFVFMKDGKIIYTVDNKFKKDNLNKLYEELLGR